MKFTCKEYIDSSVDEGIFCDNTLPNILVKHIGETEFLAVLKEYCNKESLIFNETDKDLPAIFEPDWYQECVLQDEDADIEQEHTMSEEEIKFYNKLKDIPEDKLTYIFFGE